MKPFIPLSLFSKKSYSYLITLLLTLFLWTFSVDVFGQCNSCNCDYDPGNEPNKDLTDVCDGFDVVLVLDESSSITFVDGAADQVRMAVNSFLGSVICGNVRVRVMKFGTTASWMTNAYQSFQATKDALNLDEDYEPAGSTKYTNWHHALYLINSMPDKPQLVLFWTDGLPTAFGLGSNPTLCVSGTSPSSLAPRYVAMNEANMLKAAGVHMFVVGIGGVNEQGLQSISGTDKYDSSKKLLTSDYSTTTFADIVDDMEQLAYAFCPSVICTTTPACPAESGSGTLQVQVNAGTNVYEWEFHGPEGKLEGGTSSNSMQSFSNLEAGDYSFILIDVDGCPIGDTCEVM